MSKVDTRQHLLAVGTQIFREKGFHHSGIQEVLEAAGVPKGSFYHHFRSKEDFGLKIIEHEGEEHARILDEYLQDSTYTPLQRLRRYFETKCHYFHTHQCRSGCLLGYLGQELGDQNETLRLALVAQFDHWRLQVAQCLSAAQSLGEIPTDLDCAELADFCVSSWEGALLQMKISKNSLALQVFVEIFFDHLLRAPRDP